MALFTDSRISSLRDLQEYDSGVLDVARVEGVELASKMTLAEREVGLELTAFLLRQRNAGAFDCGYGLDQVVVTPALQQWHTLATLALVYGDVYNSQLNDRYLGKWRQYERLAKHTAELLFQTGVGIVLRPLPRAGQPDLAMGGAGGPAGTYLVSIVWRDAAGNEGALGEPRVFEAPNGELALVSPVSPPSGAVAYNVYAGPSEEELTRQNTAPVPVEETWTMPGSGVTSGSRPGSGQPPELFVRLQRILQRG